LCLGWLLTMRFVRHLLVFVCQGLLDPRPLSGFETHLKPLHIAQEAVSLINLVVSLTMSLS
jgi:hypothetical protein